MSENSLPDSNISAALALRKKYFESYLKKTIKIPTCDNTHGLSTSLKRIMVINKIISDNSGKELLSSKKLREIKKFRRSLSSIRDNYELLNKLDNINIENMFLALSRKKLLKQQRSLEKVIRDKANKLQKLHIAQNLRKSKRAEFIHLLSGINLDDLLHKQLTAIEKYFDRAVSDNDDEALHRLRVKLKTFRYTYEFFAFALNSDIAVSNVDFLHKLQLVLGEAHDWYVLVQVVDKMHEEPEYTDKELLLIYLKEMLQRHNVTARDCLKKGVIKLKELISR